MYEVLLFVCLFLSRKKLKQTNKQKIELMFQAKWDIICIKIHDKLIYFR